MENMRITMKAKDAAEYLGCSYWLLLELVKKKEIPCVLMGNRKLFRKVTLDQWLVNMESLSVVSKTVADNEMIRKIKK